MNRMQTFLISSFSLVFSLYQLFDKLLALYRSHHLLRILSQARVYRPSEALQVLPSSGHRPVLMAIQGILHSWNPIYSQDESKLIYLITLLKEKSWLSSLSQIIVSQKQFAQDVYLQDPATMACLPVQGIKNSDLSKSIECFNSTMIREGTGRKGLLLLLLKLLLKKQFDLGYLKGECKVVENGIKDGSLMTLFGQLHQNSDKSYSIRKLKLITRSKESFIKHLRTVKAKNVFFAIGFLILLVISSYFLVKLINNFLMEKRVESISHEDVPDEIACIICRQRPRDLLFQPCLHSCICRVCISNLQRQECPVCKTTIRKQVGICFQ